MILVNLPLDINNGVKLMQQIEYDKNLEEQVILTLAEMERPMAESPPEMKLLNIVRRKILKKSEIGKVHLVTPRVEQDG